jgi:hypothetical protein
MDSEIKVDTFVEIHPGSLAVSYADMTIEIYDIEMGQVLLCVTTNVGRIGTFTTLKDGRLLAGGAKLTIWDMQTLDYINHDPVFPECFQLDDGRLVSCLDLLELKVWSRVVV